MLYLTTVEPRTISILTRLQALPDLNDFYLVGGTALSLKYGHRISVDLDIFGHKRFDKETIIKVLEKEFQNDFVYAGNPVSWAVFCYIQNIKVDIVFYQHPIIAETVTLENIKMYSNEDIIAMKINAILGRGNKKDFWDIYELLNHYSLSQMIDYYYKKYPKQMLLISIPEALTWFIDAEESPDPVSLKSQTWEQVKKGIQEKVRDYLK
jgi:hypothetical protein